MWNSSVIGLDFPWSLCEDVEQIPAGGQIVLPASGMPAIATSVDVTLRYTRRRQHPFTEGETVQWGPRTLRVWNLPVSSAAGDDTIDVRMQVERSREQAVTLSLIGSIGRWSKERVGDALSDRVLERENMLGIMIEQMEEIAEVTREDLMAQGSMRGRIRSDWRRAADAILGERDVSEPRMALIVRHAQTLHRHVADLGRHPRRALTRNRSLQSVHRIQEMDSACLTWYIRQPGRTPAEKAGRRQELLAIVREESVDTPENRVLRDFLIRSALIAEAYLGANRNLAASTRYSDVNRYGQTCAALLRRPEFARIRAIAGVAKPNYVLTSDPRYRLIWEAYQRLLRRQDEQDDAWNWQARLWGDTVALLVNSSLLFDEAVKPLALPALYLRKEQDHGRWLDSTGCNGVFATSSSVLMVYDPCADGSPEDMRDRYAILGPRLVVRRQGLDPVEREEDVLIWAVVGSGAETLTLDVVTGRAGAALKRWREERRRFYNDRRHARGIVVLLGDSSSQGMQLVGCREMAGLCIPLDGAGFYAGLEALSGLVSDGDQA
jgi:hypothetical protein